MGQCASKPTDGEAVVAPPLGSECYVTRNILDAGSEIKSAGGKVGSLTTLDRGCVEEEVQMSPLNTREFEIEEEREGAVRALGLVDSPVDDPRFNAITRLMSSIFQTPVAHVNLITEDRIWFKSKVGMFGTCIPRGASLCTYINVPNTPEVLVTEDASEDIRFSSIPYVMGEPGIRFYAGAPLVGRSGLRYGTLCVVDLKRRSFSAEMYALLCNFANLAVQELERDVVWMQEVQGEAAVLAEGKQRIQKMVDSATCAVALVDVRSRTWPLLYANNAFAWEEGCSSAEELEGAGGFWDMFELAGSGKEAEQALMAVHAEVAAGRPSRAHVVCKRSGRVVTVVLRPGSSDQLTPTKAIGIPNWVPSEKAPHMGCHAGALPGGLDAGGDVFEGPASLSEGAPSPELATCFWFVEVEGSAPGTPALGSCGSMASSALGAPGTPVGEEAGGPGMRGPMQSFSSEPLPGPLEGLEMGPLVGSGSFGRVYRGMWMGRVVAVKVIDCTDQSQSGAKDAAEVAVREAELSKSLDHPCIVKTLDYAVLAGRTLWMLQQLCNHGTLMEAVDRGWLRKRRSLTAPPDMPAVLRTLREVADGMAFLHSKEIMHCDLTGNNVLLEAVETSEDGRGFRAKVGDFGLARVAAGTAVATRTFGTCSHMAPELMTDGLLTKAADVWSFGVLCWEVYNGSRAYVGHRMPHIVFLVTSGKGALKLPAGAPAGYNAMMQSCLYREHTQRPSFTELVSVIDGLLAAGEEATMAPPPPPNSGGPCKVADDFAITAAAAALTAAAPSLALQADTPER